MTVRMLLMGFFFFTAVREFLHCLFKNQLFPQEWFTFPFIFLVYAVNICSPLLSWDYSSAYFVYRFFSNISSQCPRLFLSTVAKLQYSVTQKRKQVKCAVLKYETTSSSFQISKLVCPGRADNHWTALPWRTDQFVDCFKSGQFPIEFSGLRISLVFLFVCSFKKATVVQQVRAFRKLKSF